MNRKLPLSEGETSRTACARALLRTGVDEKSGEVVSAAVLAERVGWCADLVAGMVDALIGGHWNRVDVDVLASGQDAAGRRLPSNAWMALRRLGWTVTPPAGVRVNDRVVRMAQEQAGRVLRSVKWRADLTSGILSAWPADPRRRTPAEWEQVRASIPGGQDLPSSVIKGRTRQAAAFLHANGRLPVDVFELENSPRVSRMLLLAACDRQQATIERNDAHPTKVLLRLQLPTRADPRGYGDWTWVACPISLPPTVPAGAVLHLPTLRVTGGKLHADMAYTHPVPAARRTGHTIALGVDWGLNTLLSAGALRLHQDGRITALGAGGQFRAAGVLAKQHRLRRLSERLHAKADHYQRLTAGDQQHNLAGKHAALRDEIRHVSARRQNLNDALAWAAARWAVDQAIAAAATVIYLEDLRSMEARGMGATLNTRLSQQVRGKIVDRIRHLAAEHGVAVVTVPARNTSKHCPQCLTPLQHRKAPDQPTVAGWKWAICPHQSCRWQGDRDQGAWRRIAARGLTHQAKTVTDKTSGHMVIRTVVDTLEAAAVITPTSRNDRSKTGPTRHKPPRPTPRRRRAPSPTRPHGLAGKRPEGHAPTDRKRLPRAAHRHQSVNTISTPTTAGHRPRGAALGAGFHLHAHASPPRWETIPETYSGLGSLS
ncbi:Putative transposase DNA-binding domain-containing protein [Micromonospora viridifaciens]|uniref:Putative transposase DNA-binding domain-containing protein n=1 Tax=Micromonospora viridifaciens TaxID=1881 RepID=A0A1C4ZPY2_MICVI|nr:zinc ribbon domain-containing protein [Micromonospora viridifaciens]SCF35025.1 Putative transposase DNA-binding domain-containing protein [Micromonospora viridifaciens]